MRGFRGDGNQRKTDRRPSAYVGRTDELMGFGRMHMAAQVFREDAQRQVEAERRREHKLALDVARATGTAARPKTATTMVLTSKPARLRATDLVRGDVFAYKGEWLKAVSIEYFDGDSLEIGDWLDLDGEWLQLESIGDPGTTDIGKLTFEGSEPGSFTLTLASEIGAHVRVHTKCGHFVQLAAAEKVRVRNG